MRSQSDPLRRANAQLVGTIVFTAVAVTASAIWAFRPLAVAAPATPVLHVPESTLDQQDNGPAIDADTFDVVLWNPPPDPTDALAPTVAAERARPMKVNFQLLGMMEPAGDEPWRAVLYDPGADEIRIVRAGETIGSVIVEDVTDTTVVFSDDRDRTAQLDLDVGPDAAAILRSVRPIS